MLERTTPRTDCPTQLPDVSPPDPSELARFEAIPLGSKIQNVENWCFVVEPENPDCGKDVTNLVELGDFHREMDRKYREKFVRAKEEFVGSWEAVPG